MSWQNIKKTGTYELDTPKMFYNISTLLKGKYLSSIKTQDFRKLGNFIKASKLTKI